jgi:DNA-binding NarL/FixJ family response regulator
MNNVKYKKKVAEATILIVEDHDALRDSLRKWLSSIFPDCNFIDAKSGEEAIKLASSHLPDIVLMDIGLPKMSGIEATRYILKAVPKTHVVILTIHDVADYKTDASAAGAVAYIPKHAMHSELIPVMTKLLSHPEDNMLNFSEMKRKK